MSNVKRNEKGQFMRGSSGNPLGRPKGSITRIMREFMYEVDDSGFTRVQHICLILWNAALKGDLQAIKLIMDRVDGTPVQHVSTRTRSDTIKVLEISEDEPDPNSTVIA